MVFAVTTQLSDAKKVLDYLQENELLDREYQFKKTKKEISFPSIEQTKIPGVKVTVTQVDDSFFTKSKKAASLKEQLAKILPATQLEKLKTAYDQIGTIAILEIDDDLREYEIQIASALLKTNPNLQTILRKDGPHQGAYRTQPMKFLAGIDTRITTHVESGVKMIVDVERVYFSPRLSTERARIAKLVKPSEDVMVFFSGAAPYPAILGKKTAANIIVAIEINPVAHEFAQETILANKLKNVHLFCGDVRKVLPLLLDTKHVAKNIPRVYDRIIMNLPKSAHEYLGEALSISKKGTILHYYDFLHEDEFDTAIERVNAACEQHNKSCKILGIHTCGAQGIRIYRICVDVEIL